MKNSKKTSWALVLFWVLTSAGLQSCGKESVSNPSGSAAETPDTAPRPLARANKALKSKGITLAVAHSNELLSDARLTGIVPNSSTGTSAKIRLLEVGLSEFTRTSKLSSLPEPTLSEIRTQCYQKYFTEYEEGYDCLQFGTPAIYLSKGKRIAEIYVHHGLKFTGWKSYLFPDDPAFVEVNVIDIDRLEAETEWKESELEVVANAFLEESKNISQPLSPRVVYLKKGGMLGSTPLSTPGKHILRIPEDWVSKQSAINLKMVRSMIGKDGSASVLLHSEN